MMTKQDIEAMDSLRKELRPPSGVWPTDEQRLRMMATREQFVKAVTALRANTWKRRQAAVGVSECPAVGTAGRVGGASAGQPLINR